MTYPQYGQQPPQPPPYPPAAYRPPMPPRRGTPTWVWVVVGAVVALWVAVMGAITISQGDPKEPTGEIALPAGLAPVRDGNLQFTVTKIEVGATEFGGDVFGEDAHGQFIVVSVDILNVGDREATFRQRHQTLIDEQGREYEGVPPGLSQSEDYNPGLGASVQIAFDVAEGTVPAAIEFSDGGFGSGTRMELR